MNNRYKILNTFVDNINYTDLNDKIINASNNNKKIIVGNLNINAANLSFENTALKKFNDKAKIIFCDGSGISLACFLLGYKPVPKKITYNTWFPTLLKKCEKESKTIFVLGSSERVNSQSVKLFKQKYPQLNIKGHHGFFNKNGKENEEMIELINSYNPDVLAVGFGMPLQEKWILDNFHKINANVFLNGGAFLEWLSGNQIQSPQFISDIGLEWLWRFALSPKKLFKRYLIGNFLFFYRLYFK
jgi:N-acetylglucosaminyldiphosphoundecaprenol N-acetyl-beta-D-mannosaminyltransferase